MLDIRTGLLALPMTNAQPQLVLYTTAAIHQSASAYNVHTYLQTPKESGAWVLLDYERQCVLYHQYRLGVVSGTVTLLHYTELMRCDTETQHLSRTQYSKSRNLKLIKEHRLNVNWFVYSVCNTRTHAFLLSLSLSLSICLSLCIAQRGGLVGLLVALTHACLLLAQSKLRLLLLASGNSNNQMNGFYFKPNTIVKIPKFEVNCPPKQIVQQQDISIHQMYALLGDAAPANYHD
jgi:hypothetical protein